MKQILESKWFHRACWAISIPIFALFLNAVLIDWSTPHQRRAITYSKAVTTSCLSTIGWLTKDDIDKWEAKIDKCQANNTRSFAKWTQADLDFYYYKYLAQRKLITVYPTKY